MKRLALLPFLLIPLSALALTETVDGLTWTYTVTNGKASVGTGGSNLTALPKTTKGAVSIPDTLGGYAVTTIGDYAFSGCQELTAITIPDGVTSIGEGAFVACSALASVTIPSSVAELGDYAFYSCGSLTSITIPDGVTSVGNDAFINCNNLKTVFLPRSLQGATGTWGLPEGCRVFTGPDYVTIGLGRIPKAWIFERAPAAFAAANEDWEAAAQAMAANGENKVWECYVAGLDPASATNRFLVRLDFDGTGAPRLAWTPDLGAERFYYAEGKSSLSNRWGSVKDDSRFFRIRVALPIDGDYIFYAAVPLIDPNTGDKFRPDASEAAGMNAIEISDDLLRTGIKVKCPCNLYGGETAFMAIPTEYLSKIAWFASDGAMPADPPPGAAPGERYSLTINQRSYTAILWYTEYLGASTWMLKLKN